MLFQTIVFLMLICGGVLGSVVFGKRFEEGLPFTFFGIVFVLFLFGICKQLLLGVYFVCAGIVILYGYMTVLFCRSKLKKKIIECLFTPALGIYCALFVISTVFNYLRVPNTWDEFSHWAHVVKTMLLWDDFGTNVSADLSFANYPPGMALLQYFILKLHGIFYDIEQMNEWRLFFVYQIFTYSLFIPFLDGLKFFLVKRTMANLIIVCLAPTFFLDSFFKSIYIDTFMAVLFGIGIAYVVLEDVKTKYVKSMILCISCMLVLSKSIGVFFAILLSALYLVKDMLTDTDIKCRQRWKMPLCLVVSIGVPYGMWKMCVLRSECYISNFGTMDLGEFVRIIFRADMTSEKVAIWDAFRTAMLENTIQIKNFGLGLNPVVTLLVVCGVFLLILQSWKNIVDCNTTRNLIRSEIIIYFYVVVFVLYIIGLSITYMYKMIYIGTEIPAFERYMSTLYLAMLIPSIVMLMRLIQNTTMVLQKNKVVTLFLTFLILVPHKGASDFFDKKYIRDSLEGVVRYQELVDKVQEYADGETLSVFLLDQGGAGRNYYRLNYFLRPCNIKNNADRFDRGWSWSISEVSGGDDAWWMWNVSEEELQEILINNFDIFIIYNVDNYFVENFKELFENPDVIRNNCVYVVNKESGLLEFYK